MSKDNEPADTTHTYYSERSRQPAWGMCNVVARAALQNKFVRDDRRLLKGSVYDSSQVREKHKTRNIRRPWENNGHKKNQKHHTDQAATPRLVQSTEPKKSNIRPYMDFNTL